MSTSRPETPPNTQTLGRVFVWVEADHRVAYEGAIRQRLDACLRAPELALADSAAWAELPNLGPTA